MRDIPLCRAEPHSASDPARRGKAELPAIYYHSLPMIFKGILRAVPRKLRVIPDTGCE